MASTTAVSIDTTVNGTTIIGPRPDRVDLVIENSDASATLYVAPAGVNVASTRRTKALAAGEAISFTGLSAKVGWKGLSSSGTISAMVTEVFVADTGVS